MFGRVSDSGWYYLLSANWRHEMAVGLVLLLHISSPIPDFSSADGDAEEVPYMLPAHLPRAL
jgi:hypothetical protein